MPNARGSLAWLVVFFTLVGLVGARPGVAATVSVSIGDDFFNPLNLTVAVGDTVTWRNDGARIHTSTRSGSPDSWNSGILAPGQSFSRTFTQAGTFAYTCDFHAGMDGQVVVQAPAPPTATPMPTATSTAVPTNTPIPQPSATPTPSQPIASPASGQTRTHAPVVAKNAGP